MKNVRKRFLSLIMATMMSLSCVATASAADAADTTSTSGDNVIVLSSTDGDEGIMPLAMDTLRNFTRHNLPAGFTEVKSSGRLTRNYSSVSAILGVIGTAKLKLSINGVNKEVTVSDTTIMVPLGAQNEGQIVYYTIECTKKCDYVDFNLVGEY